MSKKSKPPGDDANPAHEPEPQPEPAPISASETFPAPSPEPAPAVAAAEPIDTYSAERLGQLVRLAKETSRLHNRYLRLVDKAKAAKKEWQGSLDKEHSFALNSEDRPFKLGEPIDLTDGADDDPDDDPDTASPAPAKPARAKFKPFAPFAESDDDSWKLAALSNLGIECELPPTILKALGAAELLTVGDLHLWGEPRPKGRGLLYVDIPGIGETKSAAIEEALIAFFAARSKGSPDPDTAPTPPARPQSDFRDLER